MKHTSKIGGNAKTADAITETLSNISYVVTFFIFDIDENLQSMILDKKEESIKRQSASDSRFYAFAFAYAYILQSCTDFNMDEKEVDSITEARFMPMKNGKSLFASIECINEISGERIIISEGNFSNTPDKHIKDYVTELEWYKENGYDTAGKTIVATYNGIKYEILDYEIQ